MAREPGQLVNGSSRNRTVRSPATAKVPLSRDCELEARTSITTAVMDSARWSLRRMRRTLGRSRRAAGEQLAEIGVEGDQQPLLFDGDREYSDIRGASLVQSGNGGDIVTGVGQQRSHAGMQALVEQQLHALMLSGISRSRRACAAKVSASRTSATVSWGKSATMASGVSPSPT